mmetsp:Transcript_26267/g.30004  ORF Transcript_26267/g.30004 Transcript_26267/m.30004 type:complete len:438 (-) Transcript_26267:25-1338(-)
MKSSRCFHIFLFLVAYDKIVSAESAFSPLFPSPTSQKRRAITHFSDINLNVVSSQSKSCLLSTSSSSCSSTSTPSGIKLQEKLQGQTLTRIAIPSLTCAAICYATFPTITTTLATTIHDIFQGDETGYGYETLNLILTDNSNQFIQNVHNFLSLTFAFLTASTFSFMYKQQERLYYALFEEVSLLISLLEQIALATQGRSEVYKLLLMSIRKYLNEDLKVVTDFKSLQDGIAPSNIAGMSREDLPVLLITKRPEDDPLETILYLTSVGIPSNIYISTIRTLRQARAKRLGSLQRKMPEINMYMLYILGFSSWITFPIVTAGAQTVGGDMLIEVYRVQLSLGVFAMSGVLGVINELKRPEVGSAYNVDYSVLFTLINGLENEIENRLLNCEDDKNKFDKESFLSDEEIRKENNLLGRKQWIGRRMVRKVRNKLKRNNI